MKDVRGIVIEPGDKVVASNHARRLREEIVARTEPWNNNHPGDDYGNVRFESGGYTTCDRVAIVEKSKGKTRIPPHDPDAIERRKANW